MLHSWTSIRVKFHIERSSTRVHMARKATNDNPGKKGTYQNARTENVKLNGKVRLS